MTNVDELIGLSTRAGSPLSAPLARLLERPPGLIAIAEILSSSPLDLRRLAEIGESHSELTADLLRLCNSTIFELGEPVQSLEQSVILLGAEAMRTMTLAWGIVDTVGRSLPPAVARAFWQHGFRVALLGERIAARVHYPVAEAHLAGFLHDVGRVPLLMAAQEDDTAAALLQLPESPQSEEQVFGLDHCEAGRRIGLTWQFSGPFVGAFSRHHRLRPRPDELQLVRIVSEAEALCADSLSPDEVKPRCEDPRQSAVKVDLCSAEPGHDEPADLIDLLEIELRHASQALDTQRLRS